MGRASRMKREVREGKLEVGVVLRKHLCGIELSDAENRLLQERGDRLVAMVCARLAMSREGVGFWCDEDIMQEYGL